MPEPSISVVIPTYNRAHLVTQAIDSVLRQSFQEFELIVVDDGSTDNTREVVASYEDPRLRYIHQENAGGSAARNRGCRESRAPYLLFLDSDDLLLPDALQALWSEAIAHPDAGLIGGGYQYLDEGGAVIGEARFWEHTDRLDLGLWVLSCPFIPSATLVRRDGFERVGGFDPGQEAAQDRDLFLRMAAAQCPMRWLRRVVLRYRLHPGSLTAGIERQHRSGLRLLDKLFSREDIPPDVRALEAQAYASVHLYAAARQYGVGETERGKAALALAAELMPEWVGSGILLERLLRSGDSPIVTRDPASYKATVLQNLPQALAHRRIRRRAIARVAAAQFFRDYQAGDFAHIGALWCRTIWHDPGWLRNLGVHSILVRSLRARWFRSGTPR